MEFGRTKKAVHFPGNVAIWFWGVDFFHHFFTPWSFPLLKNLLARKSFGKSSRRDDDKLERWGGSLFFVWRCFVFTPQKNIKPSKKRQNISFKDIPYQPQLFPFPTRCFFGAFSPHDEISPTSSKPKPNRNPKTRLLQHLNCAKHLPLLNLIPKLSENTPVG